MSKRSKSKVRRATAAAGASTPRGDAAPDASTSRSRLASRLLVLAVPLLAVLVYVNSAGGAFVWDDQKLILEDNAVKTARDLDKLFTNDFFFRHESDQSYGYYRPLTTLTYVVDYALWGPSPSGFHATNIALHALCSLLVVLLLLGLGAGRWAAVLAGALFAVHPIHTESVAWISGRTDLVAFLLGGGSLLLCIRSRATAIASRARFGLVVASVSLFALALLAKEMAGVVLLWMALAHVILWSSGARRTALAMAPYVAIALCYAVFRFAIVSVGVPGQQSGHGLAAAAFSAPHTVLRYLAWMILPIDQTAYVQNPYAMTAADPRFLLGTAVLAILSLAAWRVLRVRRNGLVAFLAAALAISFLPILNFVRIAAPDDMGNVMAERFCYFPSFPLLALIAVGAVWLGSRRWRHGAVRYVIIASAIAAIGAASLLTARRNDVWRDEPTLFEDALGSAPDATLLLGNLANYYVRRGDLAVASRVLDRIGEIGKNEYFFQSAQALLHVARGEYDAALSLQKEIVRRSSPGNAVARNNLAFLYRMTGRPDDAERIIARVVDQGKGYADVWFNLAEIRRATRRFDEARELYLRALEEQPDSLIFGGALASMEIERGRPREARRVIEGLLGHHPDDPGLLNNLGIAAQRDGDEEAALRAFSRAVALSPGFAKGHLNYARLLLERGERAEAAAELGAAVRLAPGTPIAAEAERLLRSLPKSTR